jgi:hypothetical protein
VTFSTDHLKPLLFLTSTASRNSQSVSSIDGHRLAAGYSD